MATGTIRSRTDPQRLRNESLSTWRWGDRIAFGCAGRRASCCA